MKFDFKKDESFCECERLASRSATKATGWLTRNRLAVLLLLIGLAGLGAQAKDGRYHSRTNLERESSLATRMNVVPPAVSFSAERLRTVARIVEDQPRPKPRLRTEIKPPISESISVRVAMQHRSPPEPLHS